MSSIIVPIVAKHLTTMCAGCAVAGIIRYLRMFVPNVNTLICCTAESMLCVLYYSILCTGVMVYKNSGM